MTNDQNHTRDFSKRLVVEDTQEYSGHIAIFAHGGNPDPRLVSVVSDKYQMVEHGDVTGSIAEAIAKASVGVKDTINAFWSHGKYFKHVCVLDQKYDFGMPLEKGIASRINADSPWNYAAKKVNNKTHDILHPVIQVTNSYSGKDSFKMFMGMRRVITDANIIIRFPKHEYEADLYSPHLGDIKAKIDHFLAEIPRYMARVEQWKVQAEKNPMTDYDSVVKRFQSIFSPQFAIKAKQMLDEAIAPGRPITKWMVLQIATYIYNHDVTGIKAYRDYNLYNRLFA